MTCNACPWLCAAQQPQHGFLGATCVELGAGLGLCGIFLAKLGAQVQSAATSVSHSITRPVMTTFTAFSQCPSRETATPQVVLTDLAQVLPVMQSSIELNGLSKHRQASSCCQLPFQLTLECAAAQHFCST